MDDGFQDQWVPGDLNLQLLNGVPRSVIVRATPLDFTETMNANVGLYAQDQWTIKRLTLNAGIRFDYFNSSVPEQHDPSAQFVPVWNFAEVPNWKDVSPRLGASYNLFGNGKTALKVTLSRYGPLWRRRSSLAASSIPTGGTATTG